MKSKIYRAFAIALGVFGLIVFIVLYDSMAQGNFMELLKKPMLFLILLIPFMPSMILMMMANKFDKQIGNYFEVKQAELDAAEQAAAKPQDDSGEAS